MHNRGLGANRLSSLVIVARTADDCRVGGHSWRLFRVWWWWQGGWDGRGLQQSSDECKLYMGNDATLRPEEVKEGKLRC
jgi:hypothetical protein